MTHKKKRVSCFLFTVILCTVCSASFAPAGIKLYDCVYIAGNAITLGDIAVFDGDLRTSKKLDASLISQIPPDVACKRISKSEIACYLPPGLIFEPNSPDQVEIVRWQGKITVVSLRNAICRNLQQLAGDSIKVVCEIHDAKIIQENWKLPLTASVMTSNHLAPGTQVVTVEFRDSSGRLKRIHLSVEVNLTAVLNFPKHPIKRGEIIAEDDVQCRQVDLKSIGLRGFVYSSDQIIGMEAARHISVGSPIKWDQMKIPALVNKGDKVDFILDSDCFSIKTQAVALQDGARGDNIWVRLGENGKKLRAVVVAIDRVKAE